MIEIAKKDSKNLHSLANTVDIHRWMEDIRRNLFSAREEITKKALQSKYSALNNLHWKKNEETNLTEWAAEY